MSEGFGTKGTVLKDFLSDAPPICGSAALLIAERAHPRAIMERLGHSTITVTLDTYGHMFPKIDAALDEALDGVYRSTARGDTSDAS